MNGDVTGSHIPLDPVENRQSRVIRQANVQDDGVREILPRHEHTFIGGFGNEALESCFMRKVAENPSEGSIVLHNEDYPAVPGQLLSVILDGWRFRSEEHTSELQSLMRISYAVFCLKKKTNNRTNITTSREHE